MTRGRRFDPWSAEGIHDPVGYMARERVRKTSRKVFTQRWFVEVTLAAAEQAEPFSVREVAAAVTAACARAGQAAPTDTQVREALEKLLAGNALRAIKAGRRTQYERRSGSYLWRFCEQLWGTATADAERQRPRSGCER